MSSPSSIASTRRRAGFTLIELLVVIAIIAVLALVGFMAASKMRYKAKTVQCVQNLRDWSVVFARCAQDRNGRLPTPTNWAAISNTPYNPTSSDNPGRSPFVDYWSDDLQEAFTMQLAKRACPCLKDGTTPGGNRAPTYMMNWRLSRAPQYLELHVDDLIRPSIKVLFIDGNVGAPLRISNKADVTKWVGPAAKYHGGKVNAVFADLHVGAVDPKELSKKWNEFMLP
jgi:prepilin-type N-terminal cleavage/methylation domain-containing protein/prepilin-type processing-associated H-X9-DG protein